jgi:restriction endonuclease-like protein
VGGPTDADGAATAALAEALRRARPDADVDGNARTDTPEQNLLPSLAAGARQRALADVGRGDGRELAETPRGLRPPFHSAHSSAALAVNAFAAWLGWEPELRVAGQGGFGELRFERQLRIFRGGRAPNLDVVLEGDDRLVGIESKCTEYLGGHRVEFSDAYERPTAFGGFADPAWTDEYRALRSAGMTRYRHLDAAQLLKHYLGLKKRAGKGGKRPALVYLYWEPRNPEADPAYGIHRDEVELFAERVAGGDCEFHGLSYTTLWREWEGREGLPWLAKHLADLRARYDVDVKAREGTVRKRATRAT